MPLELCNKCGGFHYSRDACPPKRSTAARMEVPNVEADTFPDAIRILGCEAVAGGRDAAIAGTQAPPVDAKRKVGRPKTIDDMRAYKAEKERKRRVKLKEGK